MELNSHCVLRLCGLKAWFTCSEIFGGDVLVCLRYLKFSANITFVQWVPLAMRNHIERKCTLEAVLILSELFFSIAVNDFCAKNYVRCN